MNPYQNELRLMGQVRQPSHDDQDIVTRIPSFRAALRRGIALSGLLQEEVAHALDIDAGEFSRMVNTPRHMNSRPRNFPSDKLASFARVTGSMVAQQWLAAEVGQELISQRESRVQRLERELADARTNEARKYA